MKQYTRITKQERYLIGKGIRKGLSLGEMARSIGRPKKTVSIEIKRNGGYLRYYAEEAHFNRNKSNRLGYSKIDRTPGLKEFICSKLAEKWSPEVIAGRWKKEDPNRKAITAESIYQWVYKQDNNLYLSLPRKKKKRGLKPQRSKSHIPNRTSVHERPAAINDRSVAGHYEADLVFQQGNQSQNILSVVERVSRMVILKKNESKQSKVVIDKLKAIKSESPYAINTVTFDNGSEFTNHSELGIDTYFCDPGSPWQKASVENMNGIVRTYIDYRIDANNITQEMLDSVAHSINNKPRKILGFLTPYEMMKKLYNQNLEGVTF